MATLKIEKMTVAQRQQLAAELATYEQRDAQLARLVGAFRADLEDAGFMVVDAAALLLPAKARGPARKSAPGVDKTGGKPVPGTSYTHPTTGEMWTKAVNGKGAAKKEFVALITAGKTWAELVATGPSSRKQGATSKPKKPSR